MLSCAGSAVPETSQKGRFSVRGAAGTQAGLAEAGCEHNLATARHSYPKVIFLSTARVPQAPMCRAKRYVAAGRSMQARLQADTAGPGMLRLERGSAFGS